MAKNKVNKWLYGWRLSVDYGQGWEREHFDTTYKAYKVNEAIYAVECKFPQRWKRARELNPVWESMQPK